MSNLAPQNQYKSVDMKVPRYRMVRIPCSTFSSGSVVFTPTSSSLMEFKIPASTVINLSRSSLMYQYSWPALASNYGVIHAQGLDVRSFYVGNISGLGICDVQYADCAVNAIRPIKTKFTEFVNNDQLTHFYPCNQLATSNILAASRDGLLLGVDNASTNNYLEPQHLEICNTANTAINISRMLPLSSFKDTVGAMDKDLVFGSDMAVRFYTQYLQRMGFYTTTPATPNLAASYTAQTSNVTVSNIYLNLAVEENVDIRNSLISALASGSIKMSIPYLYTYRSSIAGAATQANVNLTLTKSFGRSVRSILTVPYNGQENTQYAYDHSNVNGTKLATIQSALDGRPLTDAYLNCVNPYSTIYPTGCPWTSYATLPSSFADDYRESLKFIEKSVLNQYPTYQTHWFYKDSWADLDYNCQTPDENVDSGFDLLHSGDHLFTITATSPALGTSTNNCFTSGLIMYNFVTFNRTLEITPDGIILSP